MINVKLCMMVVLIELYLFISFSMTLIVFQGHSSQTFSVTLTLFQGQSRQLRVNVYDTKKMFP